MFDLKNNCCTAVVTKLGFKLDYTLHIYRTMYICLEPAIKCDLFRKKGELSRKKAAKKTFF
jgi:hypothetical protein